VLAGTNLIATVILEQSNVSEQGEEGEAKTLLGGRRLLSPAIDPSCEVRLLPPCLLSFTACLLGVVFNYCACHRWMIGEAVAVLA
jgi:hypothetical protein